LLKRALTFILAAVVIGPWFSLASARNIPALKSHAPHCAAPLIQQQLFSDFDGDALSDVAELSGDGRYKSIRIDLSNSSTTYLSFDSEVYDRGNIYSADIDHDNDQDLVWYSAAHPQNIFFWINDGKGKFGPATSYEAIEAQSGYDLSGVLNLQSESRFSDKQQITATTRAARTADSLIINTAEGHEEYLYTARLTASATGPHTSSPCLKAIRKRGPPDNTLLKA
jgi:hypothetical protein